MGILKDMLTEKTQLKEAVEVDDATQVVKDMADILEKFMDASEEEEGTDPWFEEAKGMIDYFLNEIKERGIYG